MIVVDNIEQLPPKGMSIMYLSEEYGRYLDAEYARIYDRWWYHSDIDSPEGKVDMEIFIVDLCNYLRAYGARIVKAVLVEARYITLTLYLDGEQRVHIELMTPILWSSCWRLVPRFILARGFTAYGVKGLALNLNQHEIHRVFKRIERR